MSSEYSTYYVPEQSKLPIIMAASLGMFAFGAGHWVRVGTPGFFWLGVAGILGTMFFWFNTVIKENMQGLPSAQLKRSYVWGMSWFIFSEVMFFACFFGALFYLRNLAVPWLAGEGNHSAEIDLLWPGFEAEWPLLHTPDQAINGEAAQFVGAHESMSFPGWSNLLHWLPLWNTLILMTSSVTVHFAHHALKHDNNRKKFNLFLGVTVLLGAIFMCLQVFEYYEAYAHMGLTLKSGVYGTTFFMLTGFHGAHVTMGTIFLAIQLLRSFKGQFKQDDHFGFEAASWYWHFVDVVWVMLFFFVYIL
jgi:cytochrome c oxidase subunit 3